MYPEFRGRTALVTGAGRNIGRAIALAFAAAGCNVAINVRSNVQQGTEVAQQIRQSGVRSDVYVGDIGSPHDVSRIVGKAVAQLGPIDYFVNSAAARPRSPLVDIQVDEWNAVIAQNLSSAFYFTKLLIPSMAERRFGRIIFIGGPDASLGEVLHAHSTAAKAGILGLARSIARAYGASGITANVVVPGLTDTQRDPDYPLEWPPPAEHFTKVMRLAVPRLGTTDEIADACLFLGSDSASFITGQILNVNGGLVMS